MKRVDHKSNYQRTQMLVLPLCVVVFAVNVYSHFHYTPDDTSIYLQYAKNIINGNGISFNAGEPTYGITSPLWLFIISAGGVAGLDIFIWAKIVDILFACAALFIFYISISPLVEDSAIRACATVTFSLNVWFLRWTGTGIETLLIPIGKYFKLNTTDRTRIFAPDVGAIGYYSDRYICDAAGLVSPALLRLQRMGYSHRRMVDEKVYTTVCGADYVIYRSLVPDELNNKKDLNRKLTIPFSQMGIADRNLYCYSEYSVRNADHNSDKRKEQHE